MFKVPDVLEEIQVIAKEQTRKATDIAPVKRTEASVKVQELDKSRNIYNLAQILDLAFSHLNHISIFADASIKKPFTIKVVKEGSEDIIRPVFFVSKNALNTIDNTRIKRTDVRNVFRTDKKEKVPSFRLQVTIGKSFNVLTHVAQLNRELARKHNEQVSLHGNDHPMVFINTNKKLNEYWDFLTAKVGVFIQENSNTIEEINRFSGVDLGAVFGEYSNVLHSISEAFDDSKQVSDPQKNDNQQLSAQDTDYSVVFEHEWEKTKSDLLNLLVKLSDRITSEPTKQEYLKKLIFRSIKKIGREAQVKIIEQLNSQSREVFFHHCEAELFRKAGLGSIFSRLEGLDKSETLAADVKMETYGLSKQHFFIQFLEKNFVDDARVLEELSEKIQNSKDQTEKLNAQRVLAQKLFTLVNSEKFFLGRENNFSFSDLVEKNEINCMVVAELLHQYWSYYAKESSLLAQTTDHIFAVVRLTNGKLFSLDTLEEMSGKADAICSITDHSVGYNSNLLNWISYGVRSNDSLKERLFEEALCIDPNNLSAKSNLAGVLEKYENTRGRAAQIYKELVKKLPGDMNVKFNFAEFLNRYTNDKEEVERLYMDIVNFSPNNPWFHSGFAIFLYDNHRYAEARNHFEEALDLITRQPEMRNFLTKAELETYIKKITQRLDSFE